MRVDFMNYLKRLWGHFKTITKHRNKVLLHCFRVGLYWQGLTHDLSKYSPTEFWQGVKYFQGTRSPNEAAREDVGYSLAWMHHKGRNKHHFEYWADVDVNTRKMTPVKMPRRYVAEMFCDRVAASKTYRGNSYADSDSYEYFLHEKYQNFHEDTKKEIAMLLLMLEEKGEKETFKYIKNVYLKGKM